MKYFLHLLIWSLFLLASAISRAQEAPPVFDWQLCLGGSSYDAAAKVLFTDDGGYFVVGTTNSSNGDVTNYHGSGDVWVVKLSSSGIKQWTKTFGGSNMDVGVSALQLSNGNIIILANTSSTNGDVSGNHGLTDIWLLVVNSTGNLLWQKTFGGSASDIAHSLVQTSDGNLLIVGNSASHNGNVTGNHGDDDFWILKVDILGNLLWQKSFGGSNTDVCNTVVETSDGGFLAAGNSNSNDGDVSGNHGSNDFWMVKMDQGGNLLWQKSFGGSTTESALSAIINTDGNFVIGGYTNSNDGDVSDNKGSSDYWMITVDSTGTLLSQHTYGGTNSDVAYSIIQAADGGYLLSGSTTSNNFDASGIHGGEDAWLLKTDANGKVNWSRCYGGNVTDRALSAIQTSDGGFILAGYSYSNDQQVNGNHGGADMWVAKQSCLSPTSSFTFTDDTLCIHSLINLTNASKNAAVYTWSVDNIPFASLQNTSFQFDSLKNYEIRLVAATCYAKDTSGHSFTTIAYPDPQIASSKPYLCTGDNLTLDVSSTIPGNIVWNTGSSQPSVTVSVGGIYSATVTNRQCATNVAFTVNEHPTPQFSLGNDTSFCSSRTFTIHAPAGYQGYLWQNGSTDSLFITSTAGVYSVTVNNGFCSSASNIHLTTRSCIFPVAEFGANHTAICENTCVDFSDLSVNATTWSWSFPGGNPSTSNVQNPTVCYSTPGYYKVSFSAFNPDGVSTSIRDNFIVVYSYPAIPSITAGGYTLTSSQAFSYQWYSHGLPLAGATKQSYTASKNGYYYVVINNQGGCIATSDSIYLNITGISNPVTSSSSSSDVFVYPNPARDRLMILLMEKWNSFEQVTKWNTIKMTDEIGRVVFSESLDGEKKQIELSTASFANGIYYLHLESNNRSVVKKVVIAH